jgi:signal transduction histidine kinase
MEASPSIADRLARLAQLEAEFQRTLEAGKFEAMAEFAAGAGHEINNPLTVISGRAQLLLHGETDPERRRALALISAQATRVYEMIADMMLFARPPRPELARVDVTELIETLIADLAPMAARQETNLAYVAFPRGEACVMADATQLAVALRAICHNALEALGSGGHVEIGVERIEPGISPISGEVRIHIRDDGPGITPEQRRHIFDPFYSARQAGRGLGLGLSKAWRIVTNHGGRIEVSSQTGQGATFTIVLAGER